MGQKFYLRKSYPMTAPGAAMMSPQPYYSNAGRIPTRTAMNALRESQKAAPMPTGQRGARMLEETNPRTSIASITRNIGMDPSAELVWRQYLGNLLDGVPDEVNLRQALYTKMQEAKMENNMRKEVMVRSLDYWRRRQAQKSSGVMDVETAFKAHQSAPGRFRKAWENFAATCGDEGVPFESVQDFVWEYGPETVSQVLNDIVAQGDYMFDGDRFRKAANKSMRFVVWG